MNRKRIGYVFALGLVGLLLAQQGMKYADKLNHAPTPMPDRLILTWSANPATTQSITWRTDATVAKSIVEYTETLDGPTFVKNLNNVEGKAEPFTSDLSTAHYHSATLTGLKPATQYTYRVGDGVNWSEWSRFVTASDKQEPFEFLYFGDAQNNIAEHCAHLFQTAIRYAPKARFLIHAGDLINNYNADAQWGEWHRAMSFASRTMPSIPVPGNHEYGMVNGKRGLTEHWATQFTLPQNGPEGYKEAAYYVDYQGVRVVGLDSNRPTPEQTTWLEETLKNNPNRWTVLAFHHPVLSAAKGRDNPQLRDAWQPLIEKYKVDLVFTGHDHTYARSNLEKTTVYAVSVVGPKQYDLERKPWMVRTAEDTQLFQIIRVNGNKLTYESRTATGEVYDAFELTKRNGAVNQLTNRIPGMKQENHRDKKAEAAAGEE